MLSRRFVSWEVDIRAALWSAIRNREVSPVWISSRQQKGPESLSPIETNRDPSLAFVENYSLAPAGVQQRFKRAQAGRPFSRDRSPCKCHKEDTSTQLPRRPSAAKGAK